MHAIRRFCCALASVLATATAASAQWTLLYDSNGFEHWDIGSARLRSDPPIVWSVGLGPRAAAEVVSSATDPTLGDRSIRLTLGPVKDSEVSIVVRHNGRPLWTPVGTRGIRFRFDLRRTPADWMDTFSWNIHTWGDWGYKGGVQRPEGVGAGSRTVLLWEDIHTPTLIDEWVTVEHVFDFWQKRSTARYGEFEGERDMGGCCYRGDLRSLNLASHSPFAGPFDLETIWIDNLVVETIGPCIADCDRSLGLDFFDFLCFQGLFAAGDLAADCDGSGSLDLEDFLCFQNAFASGCEI